MRRWAIAIAIFIQFTALYNVACLSTLDYDIFSNDTDKMWRSAKNNSLLGERGIPILLDALSQSLVNTALLHNYARSNVVMSTLHEMAKNGVHISSEVPVLVEALKKHFFIGDTYLAAETLRMISGIDAGYSKEFAERYTPQDEPERLRMIEKWEHWYANRQDQ